MESSVSGFYQFLVLMWKSFLLRKRHYIVTGVEILFPVLLASFPLIIFVEMIKDSPYNIDYGEVQNEQWKSATFFSTLDPLNKSNVFGNAYILYTPDTNISKVLIDSSIRKIWPDVKKLNDKVINVSAVKNEAELENIALELQFGGNVKGYQKVILGIVFNNFDVHDTEFPSFLDYKLRFVDYKSYYTNQKYGFHPVGPRNYDGREDNKYHQGVGLLLTRHASDALLGYECINERLRQNFRQALKTNVICCYVPTEDEMNRFYGQLPDILNSVKKGDITLVVKGHINIGEGQWQWATSNATYTDKGLFLGMQAAVDLSFIDILAKRSNSHREHDIKVELQRFPYPPYKDDESSFHLIDIASIMIAYGFIVFAIVLVKRAVEEKANGSKELMRMMGMNNWLYWSSTFTNNFILAVFIYLVIAILYKIPFYPNAIFLEDTDFFLFFVLLLLYGASSILFCLAVSTFFNRPVFAIVIIIILWSLTHDLALIFYLLPERKIDFFLLKLGAKLALCLLPNCAIKIALRIVSLLETTGKGALWSNLTDFVITPDLNLAMIMAMMLTSCIVYSIIIWYFDAVWPWKLGVPKPFYFPFTKSYWLGSKPKELEEFQAFPLQNTEFFEEDPVNSTPGVVISHLSKDFTTGLRTKTAVNNVSLKIYDGQITALLGHNGAGKTSTINVLIGMYPPTRGTASINGYDIVTSTREARTSLGLCPQHNILYDNLTVEEHLMLYAGLKGVQWSKLRGEAGKIIKLLNLESKEKELAKTLSGGMKRKLSLGIAIVGDSKVLFLDEPTSGMDLEARRKTWNMLRNIRNDRTVVLTTHYMEEADILGDRIAIMADGEIQCCGSPFFLKMKFGTGYHLHIVKEPECDLESVTTVLQKHIPEAELSSVQGKEATYSLSGSTSASLGNMFQEIENNKCELGIGSFGLSVTTMEDVFLNVGLFAEKKLKLSKTLTTEDISSHHSESQQSNEYIQVSKAKLNGVSKLMQQAKGLFIKRAEYAKRYWSVLAVQIIVPFLVMCLFCWIVFSKISSDIDNEQPLTLNLKSIFGHSKGFYHFVGKQEAETFASNYLKKSLIDSGVTVEKIDDPNEFLINVGKNDLPEYVRKYFVGGSVKDFENGTLYAKAWYNGEPYHTSAISLNVMNTAILKYVTGKNNAAIQITNAPLPSKNSLNHVKYSDFTAKAMAVIFIPLSLIFLSSSFVLVPVQENVTKAKLLQLMTGVSGITYWIVMFAWDALVHILYCVILLIPFAIFDTDGVIVGHSEAIGTALLLFLLYGWCSIPFCYLISFIVKKPSTGFSLLIVFSFITGLVISAISLIIHILPVFDEERSPKIRITFWFLRILPSYAVTWGFGNLISVAVQNVRCDQVSPTVMKYMCPSLHEHNYFFPCCKDICGHNCFQKTYPITLNFFGCGRELLLMLIDAIAFFAILFLLESSIPRSFEKLIRSWLPKKQNVVSPAKDNSDVINEKERVENLFHQGQVEEEALLSLELTKWFGSICAVDHLTFAVHNEECFGLLGINGAGKTTTFKILTGDILPTEGIAVIQNSSLYDRFKMFQSYIGFCPQYDALIDHLTGREMLTLFGRLRCLPEKNVHSSVTQLIKMVDLQEHADKETKFYSGGSKRKLSLALSLIGCPPVILLDEPTSGVDPVARRKIWNFLSEVKNKTGAAIILTTHSMEECEALCSRLAIMVNGQFRCIGPIQELKSKFGQGYTLTIKLQQRQFLDISTMNNIKERVLETFPSASLKADYQGMLQYHIGDASIPWSHLLHVMEEVKNDYQLEDYLISDTSLEQIFLTFARGQRITNNVYI